MEWSNFISISVFFCLVLGAEVVHNNIYLCTYKDHLTMMIAIIPKTVGLINSPFSCGQMFMVIFLLLVTASVTSVNGVSYNWGYINKYATPIYDKEVHIEDESCSIGKNVYVDVTYPEMGFTNDYTITAMHAFDMQNEIADSVDRVTILRGGIGYNYTVIRFHTVAMPLSNSLHYSLVIYGIEL